MRVMVVEDQTLLREGLARLFADEGHDVVGTAGSAENLDALVQRTAPDLVVLDIRMPPTYTDEGVLAARRVKNSTASCGVLLLLSTWRLTTWWTYSPGPASATCSRIGCSR